MCTLYISFLVLTNLKTSFFWIDIGTFSSKAPEVVSPNGVEEGAIGDEEGDSFKSKPVTKINTSVQSDYGAFEKEMERKKNHLKSLSNTVVEIEPSEFLVTEFKERKKRLPNILKNHDKKMQFYDDRSQADR